MIDFSYSDRDIVVNAETKEVDPQVRDPKENEKIASLVKMWADGKRRPMNGSYLLLRNIENKIVPEYV